jgi:ribosomal protein L2
MTNQTTFTLARRVFGAWVAQANSQDRAQMQMRLIELNCSEGVMMRDMQIIEHDNNRRAQCVALASLA